ncbi:MAG: CHAT domain-containing protein [Aureispira sp.]
MHRFSQFILVLLFTVALPKHVQAFQYKNLPYDYKKVPTELNQLHKKRATYYNLNEIEKAIDITLQLIEICVELGYEDYVIDLYEYLANYWAYDETLSIDKKIQKIAFYCDQEEKVDLTPVKYSYWAQTYLNHNKIDSAKFYYDLATKSCQKQDYRVVQMNLNIGFSFIYYFFENLDKAVAYSEIAQAIVDKKLTPNNLSPSYNLYIIQASLAKALGYKEQAIAFDLKVIAALKKDPSTSKSNLVDNYRALAIQYDELGDYDNAILYYNKVIKIAKKHNLDIAENIYYPTFCLAHCYKAQGQLQKSQKILTQLIDKLEHFSAEKNYYYYIALIQSYHTLIEIYLSKKKFKKILYYLQELQIIHQQHDYKKSCTYLYLSKYYTEIKDYKKAIDYIPQTLSSLSPTNKKYYHPVIFNHIAYIYQQQGDYSKALAYCQKSLQSSSINFSKEEQYSNPSFDAFFQKHELIITLSTKLQVLQALYEQKDTNITPQLLLSTIKLSIEVLEYKNKIFKSKSSQTYWLNREAIPLFENAIKITLDLYEQTKKKQYLNEAFMLSERSKSIMMMNALQEQNASTFGGIPKELIKREQELERSKKIAEKAKQDAQMMGDSVQIRYQDSLIFVYHEEKIELLENFEASYPKYYELKYQVQETSIQDVQEGLDEQTFLIEYFQGQNHIYVFTISKEKAFVHHFEHNTIYDTWLASFQHLLPDVQRAQDDINKTYKTFVKASYKLYQLLLERNMLTDKSHLILIPDGQLAYLPFEVLLTKDVAQAANQPINANFATLPYLLRQYTTNYNYSAYLFLQQQTQTNNKKACKILALAPSYSNKNAPTWRNPYERNLRKILDQLPGATRELDSLEAMFGGAFLRDQEANETNFREIAASYDILHLAVHGLVDEAKPELSGLALEEDNHSVQDNILYAYEIKQLDLNAQMVVLSACETGIGKYQRGEGVLSIGRGFMYAGVPSLVTTLWKLNDNTGPFIITEFYKNLHKGLPKDEALRQAKLLYLNRYNGIASHPALWACLVQVGNYAPLNIQPNHSNQYVIIIGALIFLLGIGIFILQRKK